MLSNKQNYIFFKFLVKKAKILKNKKWNGKNFNDKKEVRTIKVKSN